MDWMPIFLTFASGVFLAPLLISYKNHMGEMDKKLRVSEEVLDESTGSSLIVFGSTLSAKDVLARLEAPPKTE